MKKIYTAILTGSIFFMLTVLTAGVNEKKGDNFLSINDNIQNEELRIELAELKEEFNIERKRIFSNYNESIEALKEARGNEMKIVKKDFAERRGELMKKYVGKIRKKPQIQTAKPVNNLPEKKKSLKDKKPIRKSK